MSQTSPQIWKFTGVLAAAAALAASLPAAAQVSEPPPQSIAAQAGQTPLPTIKLTEAQKLVQALGPVKELFYGPPEPVPPEGPWPTDDPHDLQGTYIHTQPLIGRMTHDMYGNMIPYTMAGAKVMVRRQQADTNGVPYSNLSTICRPPGQPWQFDLHMGFQVFQNERAVQFVFMEFHGRWRIALDPALAPKGASYMGHSIGRWNGDILVVETTGYKHDIWLDPRGNPLSKDGKLTQRIRKVNNNDGDPYLEIVTTVEDPKYYAKPWTYVRTYGWRPTRTLFREYNCEEQLGDISVKIDEGLPIEPKDAN